mmetsp:Transcript_29019/g.86118  ORF Transcript_29019/g.86118 Transcript_29019/m.86118 type:complete len:277 (-) Transcript_29019:13-843(-)
MAEEDRAEEAKMAEEVELPPPLSGQPQTQLEREIMKLEKKNREIEKLKKQLAGGEVLEPNQHDKIAKLGLLRLQIAEMHKARVVEQAEMQKRAEEQAVLDAAEAARGPSQPRPESRKKERGKKERETRTPLRAPQPGKDEFVPGAREFIPSSRRHPAGAPPEDGDPDDPKDPAYWSNFMLGPDGQPLPLVEESEKQGRWDSCWEWVQYGWCPRGVTCKWEHPPSQRVDFASSLGNVMQFFGDDSDDSDSDEAPAAKAAPAQEPKAEAAPAEAPQED